MPGGERGFLLAFERFITEPLRFVNDRLDP